MGQTRGQAAHRRQTLTLKLLYARLDFMTAGQVAQKSDEQRHIGVGRFRDQQTQRKDGPILAAAFDLAFGIENALPSVQKISFQMHIMVAVVIRDENLDVRTDYLLPLITEHLDAVAVDGLHDSIFVDGNDGIRRTIDDGAQKGLAGPESMLGQFGFRDIPDDDGVAF